MVEEMLRLAEVVGTHSEKEEGCALNKRLLAAATVSVAKTKKEMPMFLIISAPLWLVKIVRAYDGRFTPVTWAILIVLAYPQCLDSYERRIRCKGYPIRLRYNT